MKRLFILLLSIAASAVWSSGSLVAAHDEAELHLLRGQAVPDGVAITVSLLYSDGHPVDPADVTDLTVEVLSPTPAEAVPMNYSGTPGMYDATLPISFDPAARLRLVSKDPAATTEVELGEAEDAATSTTAATSTSSPGTASSSSPGTASSSSPSTASSTTAAVASSVATSTTRGDVATPGTNAQPSEVGDGGDGLGTPLKVVVALLLAAVAVGVGFFGVRSLRKKPA